MATWDYNERPCTTMNGIEIPPRPFVVSDGTVLDLPAKLFLTSPRNKQGFINLLSGKINTKPRLTAKKCSDDANRFVVTTALDVLDFHKPVIVKADNTDVLAMRLIASGTKGLFLKRSETLQY